MARAGRVAGKIGGEIINVPIDLISFRLINGEFLGPELYLGEDNKLYRVPGSEGTPLTFTTEVVNLLSNYAWNARRDYGEQTGEYELLKRRVLAKGRVIEPIKLVLDNNKRLFPWDGHRRIRSVVELLDEGKDVSNQVPSIVITLGYGNSLEDLELEMWSDSKKDLNMSEKADLLKRFVNRGLTKEELMSRVGITSAEYESLMLLVGQPRSIQKLIDSGEIAITTLRNAQNEAKRLQWTMDEFHLGLQLALESAKTEGLGRASNEYVIKYFNSRSTPPTPIEALVDNSTHPPVIPTLPPKEVNSPKPNAKKPRMRVNQKIELFSKILEIEPIKPREGFIEITDYSTDIVLLPIPEELLNECLKIIAKKKS